MNNIGIKAFVIFLLFAGALVYMLAIFTLAICALGNQKMSKSKRIICGITATAGAYSVFYLATYFVT